VSSAVAGILKPDGGFRVVVTQLSRMKHHVAKGERLFIVPKLQVKEPVPFGQAQVDVIEAARKHVLSELVPVNHCGECQQCCYTLHVPDLKKPSYTPCRKLCAEGCSIFFAPPKVCKEWDCSWRESQRGDNPMPANLRPDKSGVILRGPEENDPPETIVIHPNVKTDDLTQCQMSAEMKTWLDAQEGKKPRIVTHYTGEAQ